MQFQFPSTATAVVAGVAVAVAVTAAAAAAAAAAVAVITITTTTATDTTVSTAPTTTTRSVNEKMAALIRHVSLAGAFKTSTTGGAGVFAAAITAAVRHDIVRRKNKRAILEAKARIDSTGVSLAARGFLRPQKSYKSPNNVASRIDKICESQMISAQDDVKLEDPILRFQLFVACEEEFNHCIPNSLLHTIESVGDLKQFYLTPVDRATPYEALCKIELPKNLHVQQEYHRFHPNTDTMFNGKTAFPKSSTLVSSIKYRKKYPGHMQENPWLDEQLRI